MKKAVWKKKIKESCEHAGTYRPYFDDAILTLANILEKRDAAEAQYKADGSEPLVEYVNKAGARNKTKNPALLLWAELNRDALAYWRDLGLTPAGLKKIDEAAMKKKRGGLAEVIKDLGG